jgi:hypothetical protein
MQTQIEAELASSGRNDAVPREGLIGAHWVRRQPLGDLERSQRSTMDEPVGDGSQVAPTEKAALHERERHRLQRAAGVVPAGEDGNLRQRRQPGVSRKALDAAARSAHRRVGAR